MSKRHTVTSNSEWGLTESVIMGAALIGFATAWVLFVTAPPEGLVSPYGMVISLAAGAYLIFVVFSYLKY